MHAYVLLHIETYKVFCRGIESLGAYVPTRISEQCIACVLEYGNILIVNNMHSRSTYAR